MKNKYLIDRSEAEEATRKKNPESTVID